MQQTSQEMSSSLQESTGSYSEGINEATVNAKSLTMTNICKHEQSTIQKDNRNPNTSNITASAEGIRNSSYDGRKTSDIIVKRKKSSVAKNMSGGGRKVKDMQCVM